MIKIHKNHNQSAYFYPSAKPRMYIVLKDKIDIHLMETD